MEPITALAWTLGTGMAAATAAAVSLVRRVTPERVAVRVMEQQTAIADLQRRLDADGVVVRMTYVDSALGHRLWLDADDLTATMFLFRAPGTGWQRLQGSGAILRSCAFVEPLGWHAEFDTLDGPRSAVGWRLEIAPRDSAIPNQPARRD